MPANRLVRGEATAVSPGSMTLIESSGSTVSHSILGITATSPSKRCSGTLVCFVGAILPLGWKICVQPVSVLTPRLRPAMVTALPSCCRSRNWRSSQRTSLSQAGQVPAQSPLWSHSVEWYSMSLARAISKRMPFNVSQICFPGLIIKKKNTSPQN